MATTNGTDGLRPFELLRERRGFDTTALHLRAATNGAGPVLSAPPATASARAYMRGSLPSIYQDDDFGLRFLGALETVLDPIVGLLDSLPAHVDPDLAPRDVLGALAAWLGVGLDEAWPEERWRELVRRAAELGRLRGTRAGLELELRIAFPDVPIRVEDNGGVVHAADRSELPKPAAFGFVVYCDVALSEADAAALARAIDQLKPVHIPYRLRIRAPKKTATESQ